MDGIQTDLKCSHWSTFSKDVAKQSSKIVTMLPNNDIVRKVYTNAEDGIFAGMNAGTFLIDSSTIDPAVSKEIGALAKNHGADCFVDAPVSGGVNAAAAGTLTFMVGAPSVEDFEKAKGLLEHMGKAIIHCGDIGTGGAVKICNNMLLAVSMIGVSETMNLGIKWVNFTNAKYLADVCKWTVRNYELGLCLLFIYAEWTDFMKH